MIVDIFVATEGEQHALGLRMIDALRRSMDSKAPMPRLIFDPCSNPSFVFAVDFHRNPASICSRLELDYQHICYIDVTESDYSPENALTFRGVTAS